VSELEKWNDGYATRHTILDFLDWLENQKIELARPRTDGRWALVPINETRVTLFYRYFNVDPTKLENERRELLEKQRALNNSRSPSTKATKPWSL
jgi:hypothetical protein